MHPVAARTVVRATKRLKLLAERAVKQFREHAGRNVSEHREGLETVDAEADPATQWGRPPSSGLTMTQARWFRRDSGDGMYARTPASTREVPGDGGASGPQPVAREGKDRVAWDGGEVRSTEEAGNDRGGKGPWLKE